MHPLVSLTKLAVESYIQDQRIISPPLNFPGEFLTRKSGTFVTIQKNGQLRGCIGTYLPLQENIAEETIYNAVAAATEDNRFNIMTEEELPYLTYTVYILNKPELVRNVRELNPKKFGIIVKTVPITDPYRSDVVFNGHLPYKSGLLLPDLEGVTTIDQQVSIACQKGGIDISSEKVIIYKFTVEKYA